ncbi:hypothetical protein IQ269_17495 [Tychonema sp. LEGE 07199]|uniref:hypothetical protein n=1 Tax=unclassified Tychonema TaxID=2642144 RepID=UPI00188244F1|nr:MULTISPECIES: hypothetical protein [unclassified Tychonema]MBE9122545.1 hypothetical protein [Tychonema sp. LEGE 07199]MBE9131186.1 hypothetical protein [Tychonema sp. LEGE 07196]
MKPKITSPIAWKQAELLMQPAMIRVLDNIRKQLEESPWTGTYQNVEVPIPGYQLILEHQGEQKSVDIWELCYQICFVNYPPGHTPMQSQEVVIDTSLIEEDTGDVDWNRLDTKASQLIQEIFANLSQ